MKSLLILGHNGQLARSLKLQAEINNFDTVYTAGRNKANLLCRGAVTDVIQNLKPTHVINAAAFTNVDRAETCPDEAYAINAHAAGEAAFASRAIGARFIHVSTDYVFGADGPGPFNETARPAPVNIYGQSKLAGEIEVQQANSIASIVRTSGVFSGFGSDFPSAIWERALAGEELSVVTDQITCPTFAGDLADRLIKLSLISDAHGIFHCIGHPSISWYKFACEAVAISGLPVDITPVKTGSLNRLARRPADSRLSSTKLEKLLEGRPLNWLKGLEIAYANWKASAAATPNHPN